MTFQELEECKKRTTEGERLASIINKLESHISDLQSDDNIDEVSIVYSPIDDSTQWINCYTFDSNNKEFSDELRLELSNCLSNIQNKYLEKFRNL